MELSYKGVGYGKDCLGYNCFLSADYKTTTATFYQHDCKAMEIIVDTKDTS